MDEVVLHIGMHKTGTTAIQSALDGYDDGEIRMARFGHVNHSIPVTTLFSSEKYTYHIHHNQGRSNQDIDVLHRQWQTELDAELALPRKRLIISGEKISLLDRAAIANLKSYLLTKVNKVSVIAYIREPVSFVSSSFQEQIQGGRSTLVVPRPSYRTRFEKFIDLFGRESIEFVLFDTGNMKEGSVVTDFCLRTGIKDTIKATRIKRQNARPSRETTQLTYLFNRHGVNSVGNKNLYQARAQFLKTLRELFPGPGYRFSASQVMASANLADIQWMETTAGFDLLQTDANEIPSAQVPEQTLEDAITTISDHTLRKLQKAVTAIDPDVGENENPIELLNFLFLSMYFHKKYIDTSGDGAELSCRLNRISSKLAQDRVLAFNDIKALLRAATLWRPRKSVQN